MFSSFDNIDNKTITLVTDLIVKFLIMTERGETA